MYFNKNVRYLCFKTNISLTKLAESLSTSKQSLNSILNTNNPTAKIIVEIAKIFEVKIDDLLLVDLTKI